MFRTRPLPRHQLDAWPLKHEVCNCQHTGAFLLTVTLGRARRTQDLVSHEVWSLMMCPVHCGHQAHLQYAEQVQAIIVCGGKHPLPVATSHVMDIRRQAVAPANGGFLLLRCW